MSEFWKPVTDYEGIYEVSNYGGVRRVNGAELLGNVNSYGYRVVKLSASGRKPRDYKIHRLVASAFLPTMTGKLFVNHKDGDKLNNYVGNLEWCTRGENNKHSFEELGNSLDPRPVWQISPKGDLLALYFSVSAAAKVVDGSAMMISACCNGTAKTAYNYRWEYAKLEDAKQAFNDFQKQLTERKRQQLLQQIEQLKAEIERLPDYGKHNY